MPELDALLARFEGLTTAALDRAEAHLAGLLGRPLRMTGRAVGLVPLEDAVRVFGREDSAVVAIHLGFTGALTGQILFLLPEEAAAELISWCLPEPASPELRASVLAEIGNVAGSAFLNELADMFALRVTVTPPDIAHDLSGAILGSVLPLVEAVPGRVLLVQTRLGEGGHAVGGLFLLMPDHASLETLMRLAGGRVAGVP